MKGQPKRKKCYKIIRNIEESNLFMQYEIKDLSKQIDDLVQFIVENKK